MRSPSHNKPTILAFDVGGQRIGVARANIIARIASPLTTLTHDDQIFTVIQQLIDTEQAGRLVVGLPRGLDGQETEQTRTIRAFVEELKRHTGLPIHLKDEAVTSAQAEKELQSKGKPYAKGDIDALAATYILEDYLREPTEEEA